MEIKFKTNIEQVKRKLEKVRKRFPKQLNSALKNTGNKTVVEVRKITPIDSSNLRKSISSEQTGKFEYEIKSRNTHSFRGFPEDYVKPVEFGRGKPRSSKNRNRRASRSADGGYHMFERAEKKAEQILRKTILDMIRRIGRSF